MHLEKLGNSCSSSFSSSVRAIQPSGLEVEGRLARTFSSNDKQPTDGMGSTIASKEEGARDSRLFDPIIPA